jgi:Cof subfamily protein (haloacid dehalogenase superfamily)
VQDISLIAVDLDGTLLTSEGSLASEGARLLTRAARRGVRVVLATTRNPESMQPYCDALHIDDPIICTNGAQVWGSPTGPIWACHVIPREAALTIARLADDSGWELSTTVGATTYWRRRPGQASGPFASRPNIAVVASNAEAIVGDPVRILVTQPQAIEPIRALCRSRFAHRCYVETYYCPDGTVESMCISAPGADKGTALRLVLDRLGIGAEQAIAIGDNPNDLPMFACAETSVAMGNATDEVKRQATVVAPSNDEEGVAWALQRFMQSID